jgi:hypothetical protein
MFDFCTHVHPQHRRVHVSQVDKKQQVVECQKMKIIASSPNGLNLNHARGDL